MMKEDKEQATPAKEKVRKELTLSDVIRYNAPRISQ